MRRLWFSLRLNRRERREGVEEGRGDERRGEEMKEGEESREERRGKEKRGEDGRGGEETM